MSFRINPAGRLTKKKKTANGIEVLQRLQNYLDSECDEPVEILCGFWRDQQEAITYQELREAILNEQLSQQTLQEWSHDYSVLINERLANMWTDAIAAGPSGQPILDGLAFQFNTQTPGIMNWIHERGAEFVTSCMEEQKNAIAALLSKKMRDSHTVDELSRMIRPCIGLTEGQAKANARYYDNIVANLRRDHPRMKMESIRQKAADAAQKYAERQHRQRAMTIAQTESAFAYNRGADEGIRQAQNANLLGIVKKRWSTSGDDGVCAICSSLEGTEVGMDESFDFKGKLLFVGQKLLPPAHPRCACAVEYVEVEKPMPQLQFADETEDLSFENLKNNLENMWDMLTYNDPPISIMDITGLHADNIHNIIANAPETYKKVILENVDKICFAKTNCRGKMRYATEYGIFANLERASAGKKGAYDVVFHEMGHNIDHIYGYISESKVFRQRLESDIKTFVSDMSSDMKMQENEVLEFIARQLRKQPANEVHVMSDLFAAVYPENGGYYSWKYKHNPKYWEQPNKLEHEAFAHFFSTSVRNDSAELDVLKSVFCKSYQLFEEIIEEVSKYV